MIERTLYKQIQPWLSKEKILIIKGARQTGKTTLMKKIQEDLEQKNEKCFYISADISFFEPFFKSPEIFIEYLKDRVPLEIGKKCYIFIDEFQYINNAGIFLKIIFDALKDKIQLIVSGSSSLEITKNTEFLTGRKVEFLLFPISFYEYLNFTAGTNQYQKEFDINNEIDRKNLKIFYDLYRNILEYSFARYVNFGGYPEVISTDDTEKKNILLRELVNTYLQKDIAGFLRIENREGFNNLLKYLASQIGNLVNKHELANTANLNIETVKKYLNILDGTYVFHFITPFYQNVRKELSKMKKVFISDFGMRKILLNKGEDMFDNLEGSVVENALLQFLLGKYNKENIHFYRTVGQTEIDFILQKDEIIIPIEMKFRNNIDKIPLAMKNFDKIYGKQIEKHIIVTKNTFHITNNIFFIPIVVFPFIKL